MPASAPWSHNHPASSQASSHGHPTDTQFRHINNGILAAHHALSDSFAFYNTAPLDLIVLSDNPLPGGALFPRSGEDRG
ncbi:hypothetical protein IU510_11540 [Nocardia cyriacigeorgica]|uniref:hypothetical protein n=1 Tax=Nocardia cyriacigeorgica TaxID=135487 RepID=UPI001895EA3E|nr:hypothetical protein [Nocardia cyriacigeorgica]MBF6098711.1 hypothetical protein [Nocardia cyriacigeorgica]MBF6163042.1 hypothetical protein [Nocardia cyriacigeorgica]MBF6202010.1 hypothetical protein [Nocardia cyriacigeorgica]MBF6317484.1 hypothetical protein [Nocardia cyriacigeorgica]MBF6345491.1 hypothetical protein [Nocardia cyriacigeorgica]